MKRNVEITVTGAVICITNGTEIKYIEVINSDLIRIYKEKNSEELVKLHYEKMRKNIEIKTEQTEEGTVIVFGSYQVCVDEKLNITVIKNGQPYFSEYAGDTAIYSNQKDFSLAELEGHKREETLQAFKTQINILFNTCTRH